MDSNLWISFVPCWKKNEHFVMIPYVRDSWEDWTSSGNILRYSGSWIGNNTCTHLHLWIILYVISIHILISCIYIHTDIRYTYNMICSTYQFIHGRLFLWCFLLFPRGALQVSNAYGITKAWKFQRDDWGGNGPGPQIFQWDFIDVK